jgi:hypothetical protein
MRSGARRQRLFVSWRWVVLVIPVFACGRASMSAGAPPGRLVVVDDMQRASGLSAMDVLARSMLIDVAADAAEGTAARCPRRYRRAGAPAVFVDELRADSQILHTLPASEIVSLRVVCTNDAMLRYGPAGGGGVILIERRK